MLKLYLKYTLKKSIAVNFLSLMLYILTFALLYITSVQFSAPLINNHNFYKSASCEYQYTLSEPKVMQNSVKMEQIDATLSSNYTVDDTVNSVYSDRMQSGAVLIVPKETELNKTWFTGKNLIKTIDHTGDSIYIPYNMAFELQVSAGDNVLISYYIEKDDQSSNNAEFRHKEVIVAGIIKPHFTRN